jgi:hypothetical protein
MNFGFIHRDKHWPARAAFAVMLAISLFAGPVLASLLPCCCTARAGEMEHAAKAESGRACCHPAKATEEATSPAPSCPARGGTDQPSRCCLVKSNDAVRVESRATGVDESARAFVAALPPVADDALDVALVVDWTRPDLARALAPPVSILYGVWRN